jgi:hypothetical protein
MNTFLFGPGHFSYLLGKNMRLISFLKDMVRESDFFAKINIKDDYLKCPFIQRKALFSLASAPLGFL